MADHSNSPSVTHAPLDSESIALDLDLIQPTEPSGAANARDSASAVAVASLPHTLSSRLAGPPGTSPSYPSPTHAAATMPTAAPATTLAAPATAAASAATPTSAVAAPAAAAAGGASTSPASVATPSSPARPCFDDPTSPSSTADTAAPLITDPREGHDAPSLAGHADTSARHGASSPSPAGHADSTSGHVDPSARHGTAPAGQADSAVPLFEGEGLKEVGSARQAANAADDEFDYAFDGGSREGQVHKKVFKSAPMPSHLVTNLRQPLQSNAVEEGDEGEEEEAGRPTAAGVPSSVQAGWVNDPSAHTDEASSAVTGSSAAGAGGTAVAGAASATAAAGVGPPEEVEVWPTGTDEPASEPAVATSPEAATATTTADPTWKADPPVAVVAPAVATVTAATHELQTLAPVIETVPTPIAAAAGGVVATAVAAAATPPPPAPSPTALPYDASLSSRDAPSTSEGALALRDALTAASGSSETSAGQRSGSRTNSKPRRSPPPVLQPVTSPFAKMSMDTWDVANAKVSAAASAAEVSKPTTTAEKGVKRASGLQEVTYAEALDYFSIVLDLAGHHKQVEATLPGPPGFFARLMCLSPPPLPPILKPQLVQLLSLARVPFSDDDEWHIKLLRSVFGAFTGATSRPARLGAHWELLGFQGSDPATDLRAAGVLGLLQLYCLHDHHPENAARLYRLSHHDVQEFPLAIVSLNVTTWVLQMARQGALSALAQRFNSVFEAANAVYLGTMYEFYNTWHSGGKTMADSGFVLKALEARVLKHPNAMANNTALLLSDIP